MFSCPKCGSHEFGSSNCTGPGEMIRHCHGYVLGDDDLYRSCGFSFPESDDSKYGLGPLVTRSEQGARATATLGEPGPVSLTVEPLKCSCFVEDCGCVMTARCPVHGSPRVEPPVCAKCGAPTLNAGAPSDKCQGGPLCADCFMRWQCGPSEPEAPSSKGPCSCDESLALKKRVAELEAGIRSYCEISLTSPQFRHLRDGLLRLLEVSDG